jgi:hypothetical protein
VTVPPFGPTGGAALTDWAREGDVVDRYALALLYSGLLDVEGRVVVVIPVVKELLVGVLRVDANR